MKDIVIVSAARTAVGKFGGSLAKLSATELGGLVLKEVVARAGIDSALVGEVIMGQVLAAGAGQNPARQALMKSGIPNAVPALTINAVCGSGLKSVMLAAQAVEWAPISHQGQLHDRASYRYFWQIIERAHHTGRVLPPEIKTYFQLH